MCKLIKAEDIKIGEIYYVSYGNTELICRIKEKGNHAVNMSYFTALHYWEGFENYKTNSYFVSSGIEELREATQAEKSALFRFELAKGF